MSDGNGALPEGWEEASLFDVCRPKQWPTISTKNLSECGYPVYGANGKIGFHTEYTHEEPTILVTCRGATCGTINVCEPKSWVNGNAMALDDLASDAIEFDYALYALKNRGFDDVISGSAQPQITRAGLEPVSFPLAPLAEQGRIVSKIESLLQRSSRARQALSAVGPLLDQFRQSVLRAAFSGRLTADWRAENPGVEPASELLSRIRTERRHRWEQSELAKYEAKDKKPPKNWKDKYKEPEPVDDSELPELPEGWCWANLVSIADIQSGVTLGSKKKENQNYVSVPYLRVANVQRGFLNLDEMKEVHVTEEKANALRLKAGDVLFNEGGDRDKLGRGWVWNNEIDDCIHQNHVYRARLLASGLLPKLVSHYSNEFGKDYFFRNASQSVNLASINKTQLSGLPLPVIPAEEQIVLLARLDELLAACDDVEAKAAESESSLTGLDQSILAKAFRGELVPQDPLDEPASELLKRIRQKRAAAEAEKKATKTSKKKTKKKATKKPRKAKQEAEA